jgi:EmrB/QacA subfamily drug resistance transporter
MAEKARNHWLILVFLALAQFMVVLDSSVVNVALPAIQHSFHMKTSSLQWIITAYTVTFGGFLLLGGRAADLYGRRRMFLTGVAVFAVASLCDGFAPSGGALITLRAIQGLAGAFMSPAALSIVLITYREGHARNTALSVWGAVASGGAAAGVLFGGILTEYLGWRWNFFINVPVAIIVYVVASRIVPKHESEETHNDLDLPGAASVTGAMMLLVYALVQAPSHGWTSGSSLLYFALSIVLLVFFIFNEKRVKNPLIDLSIFKIRNLTGANLTIFPVIAAMFSMFFFISLYFQNVLHYTPVHTGLSFLIVPIMIAIAATNVPRVIKKVGPKPVLVVGPLFVAFSLFLLAHIPVDGSYIKNVLPGLALLGFGGGMSFVAGTITATSGVPSQQSGLASGLLNTTQQIGGSLGLAILSGIATSSALKAIKHLPSHVASSQAASYAQVQGYHTAFYVGVCFAIAASIIALVIIRNPTRSAVPTGTEPAPVIV